MKKSEAPAHFNNEVEAHFKALHTLQQTLYLLPVEAIPLMRQALTIVRKNEVQRRRNLLKGYALMSQLNAKGRARK